ncbi:DinB family protein [Emticicia sp. SJ17W-69]|uniref:DinB family protein n=1 Tax=Emticicia sp. SJ17W-69 TaxID=3421657 RepID=UPI003EBD19F8
MQFSLSKSLEILESTPDVLISMLYNASPDWTNKNEGGNSWSVYEIIGHLIHGEKTDWIPRMDIILSDKIDKTFEPFDRFAQLEKSHKKPLEQLLKEFKDLRKKNIEYLISKNIHPKSFDARAIHPDFGEVSLTQLLATWTVHDLNHISQIARVMAKQYKDAVGPWISYLRILQN